MKPWKSPVPCQLSPGAQTFRPGFKVATAAWWICERAWVGRGVRVFRWPCGTLVAVRVASTADARLLLRCEQQLFATYARDGAGRGPMMPDVIRDLSGAAA